MIDMVGAEVNAGDFLIDDRGKIFVAQPTSPTYTYEKLICVTELRRGSTEKRGFVRQKFILRVSESHLRTSQEELRRLWKDNYDKCVGPEIREEIRQRRTAFQERRKKNN